MQLMQIEKGFSPSPSFILYIESVLHLSAKVLCLAQRLKQALLKVLFLVPFYASGQMANNPQPFAETITTADLKKHLSIIAGTAMEGRETATPGQRKAAAYIENQFKQLRLLPGSNANYQMT